MPVHGEDTVVKFGIGFGKVFCIWRLIPFGQGGSRDLVKDWHKVGLGVTEGRLKVGTWRLRHIIVLLRGLSPRGRGAGEPY